MKRIISLVLIMIMVCGLAACGNENWGVGNYSYHHVHIGDGAIGYCADVNSWHDNEMGIELHTKQFGNIYCSEGTYILFEETAACPFCGG